MSIDRVMKLSVLYPAVDRLAGPVKAMFGSVSALENLAKKSEGVVEWGQRASLSPAFISEASGQLRSTVGGLVAPVGDIEAAATRGVDRCRHDHGFS